MAKVYTLLLFLLPGYATAQLLAVTEHGDTVRLHSDRTWEKMPSRSTASKGNCADVVQFRKDDMTGREFYQTSLVQIGDDEAGINYFLLQEGRQMYWHILPVGRGYCIDQYNRIIVLFEDGSKQNMNNLAEYNCDRRTSIMISRPALRKLISKKVAKIRVYTVEGYVEESLSTDESDALLRSFVCFSRLL